ncbi:hypothetical protein VTN31DRAFT_5384 [Thermomyces dupontii]|uniref:uncharacterized protein n=1 Tax=Talaromyces thermophilus TaxID=28565 RepID=UPI0037433129
MYREVPRDLWGILYEAIRNEGVVSFHHPNEQMEVLIQGKKKIFIFWRTEWLAYRRFGIPPLVMKHWRSWIGSTSVVG